MDKKTAKTAVVVIVFVVGFIGLPIYGVYWGYGAAQVEGHDYRYEVKAEQVNENEMPNESQNYDNLTDAEREVLFRAFRNTDEFLGGSSAYVTTDEPVDSIEPDEWKIVRVKGVPILMAISGPEKVPEDQMENLGGILAILTCGGWLLLVLYIIVDDWRRGRL